MNRHEQQASEEPRAAAGALPGRRSDTPRLRELLAQLRRALAANVWLHGLGSVLLVVAAWLAFAFFADRVLRVPRPVRIGHGVVLVALGAFFLWRNLLRPLAKLPARPGLAVLFERRHPELRERFVSAVQFQEQGPPANGAPDLVERVLREADELAAGYPRGALRAVVDPSGPRSRFLLGLAAVAVLATTAALRPREASIFLDRLLGGTTPWPQRTLLTVDVPLEGPGVRITREPERIHVRVARGTDVPVLVKAAGVVPDEVRLRFEAGRDMVLSPAGGGTFRTLLRSCQEDVAFVALGGDDLDGLPAVSIEVLRPPDVEGIAFLVRPPDYSALPERLVFQREVDVLAGSEVRVHLLPDPREAQGTALLLPEERLVGLTPAPFPRQPQGAEGTAGEERGEPESGLAFDWHATSSVGFRVELTDATELTNPEPGLYRIRVVEDHAPEVQVLQPNRSEFEVVKGGAFPLRARAEDDFGVTTMGWRVLSSGKDPEAEPVLAEDFELRDVSPAAGSLRAALGHVRVEVDQLGTPENPPSIDQRFEIVVEARDNRLPEAGVGRSPRLRARIVTPEELLRRMQDRLAQARLAAVRLSDLQREKRERVRELVEAGDGDGSSLRAESSALSSALAGQRRVVVEASSVARELASITEDILYARADEKAGALLDRYDAEQARLDDAQFRPEPWLALAEARRADPSSAGGFAGNLVELVELALEISERHASDAREALAEAEKATSASAVQGALFEAARAQDLSLARMDDLLVRLAEWDNFQNILSLTRDILNRQKALRERTQQFASQK